jgi:alcohol dehydrogenase (cytochrome c)/quinohemoprotein ethanol dehydrogenase
MKSGRPIENPKARYDKTGKGFTITPAPLGGHNWQPMAFNPQTGLVYVPTQQESFLFVTEAGFEDSPIGPNLGIDLSAASMPEKPAAKRAAWKAEKGSLLAWDPVRQKEVWRVPYKGPWNGGVLTTAGNLVAQGSAAGDFALYRADNGEKVWSMPVQTAVIAGPMTYELDGEQYIAVLAGWGGGYAVVGGELSNKSGNQRNISRVLAFKLGGKATLPPVPYQPAKILNPPPETASAATVRRGKELYGRFCVTCHGVDAASGGLVPDLRYSKLLASDIWFEVVLDGALKNDGMVAFARVLDRHKASEIRSYVIERANNFKARAAKDYAGQP